MPVQSTHAEYDASLAAWLRVRDVMAGEDAVKRAGERYLPRLDAQTDLEFAGYLARACFFNATARTADGYIGLIFRRAPLVRLPDAGVVRRQRIVSAAERMLRSEQPLSPGIRAERSGGGSGVARALEDFANDVDMRGTSLYGYAKDVVYEVVAIGRAGTLVDWEGAVEDRAYATLYRAEDILNWRVERVNGRNVPTLIVLNEPGEEFVGDHGEEDVFVSKPVEQIRVLRLVDGGSLVVDGGERAAQGSGDQQPSTIRHQPAFQVEIWRRQAEQGAGAKPDWKLMERRTPVRRGKPLPLIPFVFHGPRHSLPAVDKLPLADIIAVNLDHYRLDADYKHGMHFTALPTAWVSGFEKSGALVIGSSTAWVTETPGASAGFLEYTGQGLTSFERAMEHDERLMAVLGSRLLEGQKKVGETAQAIELRQGGEHSVLSSIAASVSESLTQVLRWAYWWNSTEEVPDSVTDSQVLIELNTDFSTQGMTAQELAAVVKAWQAGGLSLDSMQELFRRGEILPEGRSNAEESGLLGGGKAPSVAGKGADGTDGTNGANGGEAAKAAKGRSGAVVGGAAAVALSGK